MTPPISCRKPQKWMVEKMQNDTAPCRFPSRKNPRMKNFDYSAPNYYFVTICTHSKRCIFGMPGKLSNRGLTAEEGILEIEKHFTNVKVDKYTVMPNHVHMILILQDGSASLPTVLGQYKSYVTKQIHIAEPELLVWQPSFHDHVIRDQKSYEKIWVYIEANPSNWNKDCFFSDKA